MKVKAVKVNRAHYFLTDPRTTQKTTNWTLTHNTRAALKEKQLFSYNNTTNHF